MRGEIGEETGVGRQGAQATPGQASSPAAAIEPTGIAHKREACGSSCPAQLCGGKTRQLRDIAAVRPGAAAGRTPAALNCQLHFAAVGSPFRGDRPADRRRLRLRLAEGAAATRAAASRADLSITLPLEN